MSPEPPWERTNTGVLTFPSGASVRGHRIRDFEKLTELPDFAVIISARRPRLQISAETRWIQWPDFWLPIQPRTAVSILHEAREKAAISRVDVACGGGIGRTGTALACIAVLEGVPVSDAVQYVREHYSARAVETPWQRRFIERFAHEVSR